MVEAMIRSPHPIPRREDEIVAASAKVGLSIPDACMPGVVANLELLARHAETLMDGPDMAE